MVWRYNGEVDGKTRVQPLLFSSRCDSRRLDVLRSATAEMP